MKSRWMVVPLGLALLITAEGLSVAKEAAEKKFECTCPVSGKPAKASASVAMKDGSQVYFCCDGCPKAYQADPKKYATKVNRQLLETGQVVQVACPLSGKPVSKEAMAEIGEADVHFCCEHCLAEYNDAKEDKKLELVFGADAMKKGFTHQTKCPVSGKPINPTASIEYKGENVYFCCPGCPKAFEENPEKYVSKLYQFTHATQKDEKDEKQN